MTWSNEINLPKENFQHGPPSGGLSFLLEAINSVLLRRTRERSQYEQSPPTISNLPSPLLSKSKSLRASLPLAP